MDDKRPGGGQITFAEYGTDFHIAAPGNALSNSLTVEESAWFEAVEKLPEKMNKVFDDSPMTLSSSVMASLGQALHGCSLELARLGSPSDRLRPAHALVTKACAEYDKGARCFATAARVGIPFAGSAADRNLSRALDRGFAASGKGGAPLADAVSKGEEIEKRVG